MNYKHLEEIHELLGVIDTKINLMRREIDRPQKKSALSATDKLRIRNKKL